MQEEPCKQCKRYREISAFRARQVQFMHEMMYSGKGVTLMQVFYSVLMAAIADGTRMYYGKNELVSLIKDLYIKHVEAELAAKTQGDLDAETK